MNRRVAVRGPLFSGKTTTALALETQGFHLIRFNDSLKATVARHLSEDGFPTSVEDILADKERYRRVLQEWGTLTGFDDGLTVPSVLAEAFDRWGQNADYVFDNVRFLGQWHALQSYGFRLVKLDLSPMDQELRATAKGISHAALGRAMDHPAEVGFPVQEGELVLDATMPVEHNVLSILSFLKEDRDGQEEAAA